MSKLLDRGIVSKSQLNSSRSKMMYSFPHTKRFKNLENSSSSVIHYDLPEVKCQRSASIGYGNKSDFTSGNKVKAPYYNLPSGFNQKKPMSPTYTFGIAREYYEKVYCGNQTVVDKSLPGPGKYNYTKPLGQEALKFSLFGRRKNPHKRQVVPGPGTYEMSIDVQAKTTMSSLRNSTNCYWSSSKFNRFSKISKIFIYKIIGIQLPGPGEYEIKDLMNGTGSVFNSKFKSGTSKSIAGRQSDTFGIKYKTSIYFI